MIRYFYYQLHPQTSIDDFMMILNTSMLTYEHVVLATSEGYLVAEDEAAVKLQQSLAGLLSDIDYGAAFLIASEHTPLTHYLLSQLHWLTSKKIWYSYEIILQLWKRNDQKCLLLLQGMFAQLTREELDTLQVFVQNMGNSINTSEQLYIHRNTLHYRLLQIEDKTGLDGRDFLSIQMFVLFMSLVHNS